MGKVLNRSTESLSAEARVLATLSVLPQPDLSSESEKKEYSPQGTQGT